MRNIETENTTLRKKITGRATILFISMMVLLTFFSNTINNFSLPRVKAERPTNGSLVMEVSGEGKVEPRESIDIYADTDRKVGEVKVKTGDLVKKGQILATLEKDRVMKDLEDEQLRLEKLRVELEKLMNPSTQDTVTSYERAVETGRLKLEDAQRTLEIKKKLYDAGAESAENFRTAQRNYDDAKRSYDQAKEDYAMAKENQSKKDTDNARDIKNKQLDISIQENKVADLKRQLNGDSEIIAPANGLVTEVNIARGGLTSNTKPAVKMSITDQGFEFKVTVDSEKAGYLTIGEEMEVNMTSMGNKRFKGALTEARDNEEKKGEKKDLVIQLTGDGLSGGEKGEIYVAKKTKTYVTLVSNTAINEDNDGKYVLVVKEKKGPLGNEYYLQRANVQVDESDNSKTAITSGVSMLDKIVVESSKAVSEGSQVTVEREQSN